MSLRPTKVPFLFFHNLIFCTGNTVDSAVGHIRNLFLNQASDSVKDNIETHVTCALDRDMMGKVFDVIVEHILMTRMQV